MKIIATQGNGAYVAVVSHEELEKVFDKYYGKLERLKEGQSVDLGAGYNFRGEIKSLCRNMTDAMGSFERTREALLAFSMMVAGIENKEGDPE